MKKKILAMLLAVVLAFSLLPGAVFAADSSPVYSDSGSTAVAKLTKQEIARLMELTQLSQPTQIYDTAPDISAPYSAGSLRQDVIQAGLDRLNVLRRIAGLPAVSLDSSYIASTQAAALVNAVNHVMTHYPTQPSDMDNALYNQGAAAARSSNIAYYYGYRPVDGPIAFNVDMWMDDSDASNVSVLGHRRWQLNPTMSKTGFGAVYASDGSLYAAEYAFDRGGSGVDYDFIAWPSSGNFPAVARLFYAGTAWSVTLNPSKYQTPSKSAVTVTLTRESDGYSWTFSGSESYTPSSSGKYFNVDTGGYGVSNCIIFRPDGVSRYEGVYTVTITGLQTKAGAATTLSYQVDFFNPDSIPAEPDPTEPDPTEPDPTEPDPTEPDPTEPEEPATSGKCGENLTWSYSDGVLTIQGAGPMADYEYGDHMVGNMPWYDRLEEIRTVIIDDGVTSIGDYAFAFCHNLTDVTIPGSVTSIGVWAFYECSSLTSVVIPDGVTTIPNRAFSGCNALTSVTIPASVTTIESYAFQIASGNLTDVYYGGSESQWDQIDKGNMNWPLVYATVHFNADPAGPEEPEEPTEPAEPEPETPAITFTDVPANAYYAAAVTWAVDGGIVNGTGNYQFRPTRTCSEGEILTMLYRASGETAATTAPLTVASWYQDAVNWAYEKKMIDSSFDPDNPCTRSSAVYYIWLAHGKESARTSSFTDVEADADYAMAVSWAVEKKITKGTNAAGTIFSPYRTCMREEIVTLLYRAYVN